MPRPAPRLIVSEDSPSYRADAAREADFWARSTFTSLTLIETGQTAQAATNLAYTGDARTTWIEDLIRRGPFEHAAALGCSEGAYGCPIRPAASHTRHLQLSAADHPGRRARADADDLVRCALPVRRSSTS
jgi:hypothetical protein